MRIRSVYWLRITKQELSVWQFSVWLKMMQASILAKNLTYWSMCMWMLSVSSEHRTQKFRSEFSLDTTSYSSQRSVLEWISHFYSNGWNDRSNVHYNVGDPIGRSHMDTEQHIDWTRSNNVANESTKLLYQGQRKLLHWDNVRAENRKCHSIRNRKLFVLNAVEQNWAG